MRIPITQRITMKLTRLGLPVEAPFVKPFAAPHWQRKEAL